MVHNIEHISKQTEVISMQRLKLLCSFCLLSTLLIMATIMCGVANAQQNAIRLGINDDIAMTNPHCDGNYHYG